MTIVKNQKLSSWLVSRPAIFAIMSFGFMIGTALLTTLIANLTNMGDIPARVLIGTCTTLAFLTAVAIHVRKLPPHNLDQYSFVAINNAQTLITSTAFIASTLLIIANAHNIMLKLLWLETHTSPAFIIIMIIAALFYLYITGIHIGNIYAKYRRVRTLGVPMWRTLCTAPFGFAMLWIPGYMLPDNTNKEPVLTIGNKWYMQLTNWIVRTSTHTAGALVLVVLLCGLFFGFNAMLLLFGLGIIFAIWAMHSGLKNFRANISGAYTWTAIGINIVIWIFVLLLAAFKPTVPNDINFTISDIPQTQQVQP